MKALVAAIFLSLAASAAVADDCEFIRNSIQNLPASGGEVVVPNGVFTCSTPIVIDKEHITLRGQGLQSVLKLADNANSPLVIMGETATPPKQLYGITVRDLKIDGNRQNQKGSECWGGDCNAGGTAYIRNNGITVRGITNGTIQNVFITSPRSGGVVSEKGCYNLLIDGLTVTDSYFDGFAGYETYVSTLKNLHFYGNNAAGISIDLHFSRNKIQNALIENNRDVGIFMRESDENIFENIKIVNAGNHGVFLAASGRPNTCANGNEFRDLTVTNALGVGFMHNDDCVQNRLTGVARFSQNRDGCVRNGGAIRLAVEGQMICE